MALKRFRVMFFCLFSVFHNPLQPDKSRRIFALSGCNAFYARFCLFREKDRKSERTFRKDLIFSFVLCIIARHD